MSREQAEDKKGDEAVAQVEARREGLDPFEEGSEVTVVADDPLYAWDPKGRPVPGSKGIAGGVSTKKGYQTVKFLPPTRLTRGGYTNDVVVWGIPLDCLEESK